MTRQNHTSSGQPPCVRTRALTHTRGTYTLIEACSRRCPALLLAPMRVVSSRVSVNLYSHLTILSGVTVIHVRTTASSGSARWPPISTANGMHTLLPRVECCKRKMSSRCQIYKRKRHKMFSPKVELNRIRSII